MKFSLAVFGAAALQATYAQIALPTSIFGLSFSQQCQQTVLGVLTQGNFSQCIRATDLLPIFTMPNTSIVPYLDMFMSDICYNSPCSNATLTAAAATINQGCAADLANDTMLPPGFVNMAFAAYPLVREVLCLKTSQPYTASSYGGFLGAPAIPITAYNSTMGYFCVSSVLTQLSAYFGGNITYNYIASIVSQQNTTALNLVQSINPNIICNGCIFGAFDVINKYIPSFGMMSLKSIAGALGLGAAAQIPANLTLTQGANAECAYVPLMISTNGSLPTNITQSAVMTAAMMRK